VIKEITQFYLQQIIVGNREYLTLLGKGVIDKADIPEKFRQNVDKWAHRRSASCFPAIAPEKSCKGQVR
jgi:hypothetical protein